MNLWVVLLLVANLLGLIVPLAAVILLGGGLLNKMKHNPMYKPKC